MRAVVYRDHGPAAEVLRIEEVDTPSPGPGEVRVRVAYSAVNPTDWKARSGAVPQNRSAHLQVPNMDGAGVVDEVGPGVDPGRIGQRVWLYLAAHGRPWGTAAQFTVLPSDQAIPLPDNASMALGASLGVPGVTAHRCLFADGPLDGRTVLVAGGAGAVGRYAIQQAVAAGATVISTVSGDAKATLAREAGAPHVVNYRSPDAADQIRAIAPEGVDRFVEVALASNLRLDLDVAAPNAVIASYAAEPRPAELPVRELMNRNLLLRFVLLYTMPDEAFRQAAADLTAALAANLLTPPPTTVFPLDDTAAAHDAVEGGAVGKVLIAVDPDVT
ncbi:NADPH:quinone reductase [Asanoa sp. WMMD1127]|uniref:NADPH:quinone reductase n=1 Tax=Asanoa sp. WMMD1127 TaxID=3016107 RepID=UPI002416D74A|nr:NADPH:quinone reductase [Asanoa sp. WMMD1127]MDG4824823.1 NADPH:quinone reductase [Asanoa sp. WMMD1127]